MEEHAELGRLPAQWVWMVLLSNILKSAAGTCPFRKRKSGIPSRDHSQGRRVYYAGFREWLLRLLTPPGTTPSTIKPSGSHWPNIPAVPTGTALRSARLSSRAGSRVSPTVTES